MSKLNKLIIERTDLLMKLRDLSRDRANELGKQVKAFHNARSIEERNVLNKDYLTKSLDYSQKAEDIYSTIIDIDTILIEALFEDEK